MGVKEKLVELLNKAKHEFWCRREKGNGTEFVAEYLIANGVTVQEWISVNDKLPNDREWVLVWHTGYATPKKAKYKDDFSPHLPVFLIDGDNGNKGEVTHWMPMPQPPKAELQRIAPFICCPICDEDECVGRNNCNEIKRFIENRLKEREQGGC